MTGRKNGTSRPERNDMVRDGLGASSSGTRASVISRTGCIPGLIDQSTSNMAAVKEKLPNLKICIDNEESGSDDDLSLTEEPDVSIDDGQSQREVKRKPDPQEPDSPMSSHAADDVQFNVYLDKLEKIPEPTAQTKIQVALNRGCSIVSVYNWIPCCFTGGNLLTWKL